MKEHDIWIMFNNSVCMGGVGVQRKLICYMFENFHD